MNELNNKKICWSFPSSNFSGLNGSNNPGSEHFKDDIVLSLAREICQNSLDARKDKNEPVIVEFKSFELDRNIFPGFEEFYDVILKQIEFARENYKNDDSTLNFYLNAKRILDNDKIYCLRISDFNTTGLTGSNNPISSNWMNLVKNVGVSDKSSTSGGSFGIGKFASFAFSKLYTVFYNTISVDGLMASQGVAKLSSYKKDDGDITLGVGYYGLEEKLDRIPYTFDLDPSFKRKELGTDIFILGFDNHNEQWKDKIIAAIIDNFMLSIIDNKLIVKIDGNRDISKENLKDIFLEKYEKNKNLYNEYTKNYFEILLTSNYECHKFYYSMFQENDAELTLAVDTNMKNRVAIIRNNGMKIFDKSNLPKIAFYSGILQLKGEVINSFFRKMENPQHDGWSVNRHTDEKEADKRQRELFEFIRKSIRELVETTSPESVDAEGVGEFLPDDMDIGTNEEATNESITDKIEKELEVKEINSIINKSDISYEEKNGITNSNDGLEINDGEDNVIIGGDNHNDENGGSGSITNGTTTEEGINNVIKEQLINSAKYRCFYSNGIYNFIFKTTETLNDVKLHIEISGEQTNKKTNILFAKRDKKPFNKSLKFEKNIIYLGNINPGENNKIIFKLDEKEEWSLEVKMYADKK